MKSANFLRVKSLLVVRNLVNRWVNRNPGVNVSEAQAIDYRRDSSRAKRDLFGELGKEPWLAKLRAAGWKFDFYCAQLRLAATHGKAANEYD
jgi:hypothetical protein